MFIRLCLYYVRYITHMFLYLIAKGFLFDIFYIFYIFVLRRDEEKNVRYVARTHTFVR